MRFSWISNSPWTASGYGQQTRIVLPRIADGMGNDVAAICYYGLEGGVINYTPRVMCFPKRYHPYGNDISVPYSNIFGAQFMISLTDVWVLNPEDYPVDFKWVAYMPVDHEPMPAIVRNKAALAWKRASMSKYGTEQIHKAGLSCTYIPHCLETGILHRTDKQAAREKLGLPQDKWIVGTVAMNKGNPSRKNFVEMMQAYANFHARHTDTLYFLQTDRGEGVNDVVNLPELARNLGLIEGKDIVFCHQLNQALGFAPDYFSDYYSAVDVHLLVSAGEGFGIPTLEAQACACPVIVGDWTASSELCFAGHKIDKRDAEPFYSALASWQFRPHVRAVELALEAEYKTPTPQSARDKAVEIVKQEYDAGIVVDRYWKPFLAEIERDLDPQHKMFNLEPLEVAR